MIKRSTQEMVNDCLSKILGSSKYYAFFFSAKTLTADHHYSFDDITEDDIEHILDILEEPHILPMAYYFERQADGNYSKIPSLI